MLRKTASVIATALILSVPVGSFAASVPDISSDASLARFVGPGVGFSKPGYVPAGLVTLRASKTVVPSKKDVALRKEAYDALAKMAKDFFAKFKKPIVVVSGYRSYEYQQRIKKGGCPDALCAKAGYSEHQTGLAADLFEATTQKEFLAKKANAAYFQWLSDHAEDYGFHNSYQKGPATDGYEPEPWHWRYVGAALAKELKSRKETFSEYAKKP
jgi:D-alanyl-D-alanine carboxypeptidase